MTVLKPGISPAWPTHPSTTRTPRPYALLVVRSGCVPRYAAHVCRLSRVEITSPAVNDHDGFQFVASTVDPSYWPWFVTPDQCGSGMAADAAGNDVCAKPSGIRMRARSTSANGRPVTFSITMPSRTVLVSEYSNLVPAGNDGGWALTKEPSWAG